MKKQQIITLTVVCILASCLFILNLPVRSIAQSDEQVKVTYLDSAAGYLLAKLALWDDTAHNYFPAIRFDSAGSTPDQVKLAFNPSYVGDGAIWGGGTDFTWEFNAAGSMDPSITFRKEKATFNGTLEASNFLTTGSESFSSNIANFTIDAGEEISYACGYKFESPSLGENASITNAYGLVLEPVYDDELDITHAYGIYQMGENDINSFRGYTGMGMWDGVTNAVLQIAQTYDTDDSNYGIGITIEQEEMVQDPSYPSGITCNLNYSAQAVTPVTILKDGGDNTFTFEKGNSIVTAAYTMTNPPVATDWIKPASGSHWYVVTLVDGLEIHIIPAFEEDTTPQPVAAEKIPAAYRMSGISGSNVLSGTGATSALRGVNGSVGISNAGNVQAGIGTRGGMTMTDGWMGLGACLGTYTDISGGVLDYWYGLGIESPIFSDSAVVNKEIAGIGIGSLLRGAVVGTVDSNCMVYGVKIKKIDPEESVVPIENTYGIYQEGNEQNYFGGSLTIINTTKVKYSLATNYPITYAGGWTTVRFATEAYDQRDEYDIGDSVFIAYEDGLYDVDANVVFLATGAGDYLELRILKIVGETETEYSYAADAGYYDPSSPSATDNITVNVSDKIPLLADEMIRVEVKVSTDLYISAGLSKTYISIHKSS